MKSIRIEWDDSFVDDKGRKFILLHLNGCEVMGKNGSLTLPYIEGSMNTTTGLRKLLKELSTKIEIE